MPESLADSNSERRPPWWQSIGPALITACVVFGPGSLLISSNVGATYGYELLWLLLLTGVLMGMYMTMAARIGVVGGATPCKLVADRLGRPVAAVIGITLCLICTSFQFSNNLAVAAAVDALGIARLFGDPQQMAEQTRSFINSGVLLVFNALIIILVFSLRQVYNALERIMKIMVAVILVSFLANLFLLRPDLGEVLKGLKPQLPEGISIGLLSRGEGGGVRADYFNDTNLSDHVLSRIDPQINFGWTEALDEAVGLDNFSVRWTGNVKAAFTETYTFYTNSADGVRLWVDGKQLVDNWTDHGKTENSGNINLVARQKYSIVVEYYENSGDAIVKLRWSSPRTPKQIIPQAALSPPDPMLLIGALLGTTFSVAAALYQGNLVREKGWTIRDYDRGIGDSIAGVAVLTGVSAIIMITSGKALLGQPANDISVLASQLRPLLHTATHVLFCVGLLAVATNPFVINAMIGGSILADGIGKPAGLSNRWSRIFTVVVLLVGMAVAMIVLHTPVKKVDAIIFGQAFTVVGNPLMAITILWLANRKDIMGDRRNRLIHNIFGGLGLLVVVFMAIRVLCHIVIKLS